MPKFVQGDLFGDPAPEPESDSIPVAEPASSKTTFLGWDRPIIDSATDLLFANYSGQRLVDLSNRLVIVPTSHAGRRLREALATRAAESDGVVIPPAIAPPEFLISPKHQRLANVRTVAGNAQVLLTWADILRQIDLEKFRHLFPVDPVERSFTWAIQTASDILTMRKSLGEAGLTIADAAEKLAAEGIEPGRWKQLADIENRALIRLEKAGLEDFDSARRHAADNVKLPPGITKVIVLGTPDPTPLVIQALANLPATSEIEIAIHAPDSRANHFDTWGRPISQLWTSEQIDINPDTIHLTATPTDQAETTIRLLANHGDPAGLVAIGVPDEEVTPPLKHELSKRGLAAFDPGGNPLQRHEIYQLLRNLADLISSRSYPALAQLIRTPAFIQSIATQSDAPFDQLSLITTFDELYNDHLPDNLEHTANALSKRSASQSTPEQAFTLTFINRWLTRFEREPLSITIADFLHACYPEPDATQSEIIQVITDHLEELESPITERLEHPPSPADLLRLLLQLLATHTIYPGRETDTATSIDLQGWLELLWEDSPHLIITGLNDGKVPDAILGDAYLPNHARQVLGIRDNDHRLARDAYYLTALIQSRAATGRVDLIAGKTAADNSPIRPSRLLFHCPEDELPARTAQLFAAIDQTATEQPEAWTRTWQLTLPPLPEDAKIRRYLSVTQFSSYLDCPFRFFLRNGLRMEEFDRQKLEMDYRDFGNVCHDALETFGCDTTIRDSTDPTEISNYLYRELDRLVTHQYGQNLPVPILIQLESAKQRLDSVAKIQAREREAGWKITDAEWAIEKDKETNLPTWSLAGMPISFKIDRIEKHEQTGDIRVLDYKTSDKAEPPITTHLKKLPTGTTADDFPAWQIAPGPKGKPHLWTNLQLPLYILALQEKYPEAAGQKITTGLFKLPKASSETKIDLWEDLTEDQLQSAKTCAEGVIEGIKKEIFWPPTKKPKYDDYKKLFFEDAEASIKDPTAE